MIATVFMMQTCGKWVRGLFIPGPVDRYAFTLPPDDFLSDRTALSSEKIIRPAVVCRTLVTIASTVIP